jgi:hypothetical protein
MPNRSITNICRCQECIATHPNGRIFLDHTTFKSHTRRIERANQANIEQAVGDASRELFVTTLSEGAIALDSQAHSSRPTESINDIADRLSDITIRPDRSSHRHSPTPSLTAEHSLPAATRPSPSNVGSVASSSSSSTERPSLQERKRSRSKYTQNQLSILCHVQSEILCCNMSLRLPISRPLLDQAQSIIAVSRQQVNQIFTYDKTVTQFKGEVTTLLDSLESRWRDLSSTLPDEEPMVYPTGKANYPIDLFFQV